MPGVEDVKKQIAAEMLPVMNRLSDTLETQEQECRVLFEKRGQDLITRQRGERRVLNERLEQRQTVAREERQKRFRTGFRGLWDRLSGRYSRIVKQNEREAFEAFIRDRAEKEEMIFRHLGQRRTLNALRTQERNEHQRQEQDLRQDVQHYKGMLSELREG